LIPGSSVTAAIHASDSDSDFLSEPEDNVDDIDIDALREAGVIPDDKPAVASSSASGKKGKGKQVSNGLVPGRGHTIFTDDQQECELSPLK
jgi:hypothetical protein